MHLFKISLISPLFPSLLRQEVQMETKRNVTCVEIFSAVHYCSFMQALPVGFTFLLHFFAIIQKIGSVIEIEMQMLQSYCAYRLISHRLKN